jgi:hypothetical protein
MRWQRAYGDNPEVRKNPALAGVALPPELGAIGDAGLLATAGGLLFSGSGDYAVHAIDSRSGKDLWTFPTGDLKTTGTPMTYRVHGEQYVIIAIGGPGEGATLLAFALTHGPAAVAQLSTTSSGTPRSAEQVCSQCHSFELVTQKHRNRKQWEAQIESMIAKGARISNAEFDAIAEYLGTHYGED